MKMKSCVSGLGSALLVLSAVVLADCAADDGYTQDRLEVKPDTVIAIDFGSRYSRVGVMINGSVEIIADDQGNRITPSYVAFTLEGQRLVGDAAKNQLTSNPENTVFGAKRLIGRKWDEPSVQQEVKYFPFKVINKNNKPNIEVTVGTDVKVFTPEEISAMVLSKMKEVAEAYLGKNVTHAVVTVPAYFNDAQRQATKAAGTIAGLNIMRIIYEPSAAAIAYDFHKTEDEKNILVFDLGGSTFDVTVLTIDNGVFEVISTNGDIHLGGEDFDVPVMDHFIKLYKKKKGVDVRTSNRAVQTLRREVEKAKRVLSSQHQTKIEIEAFFQGEDFSETLTRAKFEELNMDLFRATMKPIQMALVEAEMTVSDIHDIILAGGSSYIPKLQQLVRDFFQGKEPISGVNPDEVVVLGAAIQGGVLSGPQDTGDCCGCDATALAMGIETTGGMMTTLIPKMTFIPTRKSQIFSTTADNQATVTIKVYEGEHPMTKGNHYLGLIDLSDIPPAPRGQPQIEVTFEIDVNGFLTVSAEDKGNGIKNSIVVENDQLVHSMVDVQRMVEDAKKIANGDAKVKGKVESGNELEKYDYGQIKEDLRTVITDGEKEIGENAVNEKNDVLGKTPDVGSEEYKNYKTPPKVRPTLSNGHLGAGEATPGGSKRKGRTEL